METSLTTRREPEKVRLIDANALKERMNSDFWSNVADLVDALEIIDSAPTVETTDDVLTRIGRHPTVFFGNDEWNAYVMQNLNQVCNWKTPLEAVTRLESSLNPK